MDEVGCILDVTHLTDACFDEALELYSGPIWASHSNARTLVPHQRQLSDEQIRRLTARGSVIGVVLDAWMLAPDWIRGESNPETMAVSLSTVADHIEHIAKSVEVPHTWGSERIWMEALAMSNARQM